MTTILDNEWQTPVHRGYKIRCCDCGLTHAMDFRVVGKHVQFRVRRLPRRKRLMPL